MLRRLALPPLLVTFLLLYLASPAAAAGSVPQVPSPAWQTNGTVYALAYANGAVYLGGSFTSVRPPGSPAGQNEVARNHLAAFSAATGALLPFNHDMDTQFAGGATVWSLVRSPDGSRIYAGGDFTLVDGAARSHVAAFDVAGGGLISGWRAATNGRVRAMAVSGATVYLGGTFTQAYAAGVAQARRNLAAYSAGGTLLPWTASPDDSIRSMAVVLDGSRVIVGGSFDTINGRTLHAIASLDAASGALMPWVTELQSCSETTTIVAGQDTVFVGGEGTGGGCFDGTFAADPATGRLRWFDNCLGATQALTIIGSQLVVGSHAHDCSDVPGGFPQIPTDTSPHHLMIESTDTGEIDSSWHPNTDGNPLGPRALATDGQRLFIGGDFTYANTTPQQGFAKFG